MTIIYQAYLVNTADSLSWGETLAFVAMLYSKKACTGRWVYILRDIIE
jgi:hypothetical protein